MFDNRPLWPDQMTPLPMPPDPVTDQRNHSMDQPSAHDDSQVSTSIASTLSHTVLMKAISTASNDLDGDSSDQADPLKNLPVTELRA